MRYAVYMPEKKGSKSGPIVMSIFAPSRKDLLANLPKGARYVKGAGHPATHHVKSGKIVEKPKAAPQPKLAATIERHSALLRHLCASAIRAGFTSDALGAPHRYPNAETDQLNRSTPAAAGIGASIWCADASGAWARREHTAEQLRAVCAAGAAWVAACMKKHETLGAQLASAESEAAVAAVTWNSERD